MKHVTLLFLTFFIILSPHVFAQEAYTISGTVIDEQNNAVAGATVFINGSQKITASDAAGQFKFSGIAAGNYMVSTKMIGYSTPSLAITIHDTSPEVTIKLKVNAISLNEVKITSNKNRDLYLSIFKDQFLGKSTDKKKCVILNPEILSFNGREINTYDILLKASADDLLMIENNILGYKIKYLLRSFEHNAKTGITYYDGESNFEEMEGTAEQKKTWQKNRLTAYLGSSMHFLRSVYANTLLDEGFVANQMIKSSNVLDQKAYLNPNPVKLSLYLTRVDSSFVSYKFNALNIIYKPRKAAQLEKKAIERIKQNEPVDDKVPSEDLLSPLDATGKNSQLLLYLKEALIDKRGSVYTGYKTFLIRGYWSGKRIGDQLPFEYQPN